MRKWFHKSFIASINAVSFNYSVPKTAQLDNTEKSFRLAAVMNSALRITHKLFQIRLTYLKIPE